MDTAKIAALENLARRANDANSMNDYKQGSATNELNDLIDGATQEAAQAMEKAQTQKQKDEINEKLERYKNGLIDYFTAFYSNEAACPSVMVAGPANFPIRKKERQNARRDTLHDEYNRLDSLRHSFKGCTKIISNDDPEAVEALESKINAIKTSHAIKIEANAYFRAHETLQDFPKMSQAKIDEWEANHKSGDCFYRVPFMEFELTNENAEIKRLENRLATIKQQKESTLTGWSFKGGRIEIDNENARIAVYWSDKKRGSELEEIYKTNGDNSYNIPRLLWSPRFERWQCFINPRNIEHLRNSNTYAPTDEGSQKAKAVLDSFKDALKQAEEKDKKENLFTFGNYRHLQVLKTFGFLAYYKNEIKKGLEKHPTAKNTGAGSIGKWFIDDGKVEEATAALLEYVASKQEPSERIEFKTVINDTKKEVVKEEERRLMLPACIYEVRKQAEKPKAEDARAVKRAAMMDDLEKRLNALERVL